MRNDACLKINVHVFHSLAGVRKKICQWLCQNGFGHGFVQRRDNRSVEVVIAIPIGPVINVSAITNYFGRNWFVTKDFFTIDKCCRDIAVVQLLTKPFFIWKSRVEDPDNKSDDNFDCWSSDGGGWEIRSVGSLA